MAAEQGYFYSQSIQSQRNNYNLLRARGLVSDLRKKEVHLGRICVFGLAIYRY